ncbi:MAG: GAF domain-containing protein, partial [Verrucomicrobiia bacterium]
MASLTSRHLRALLEPQTLLQRIVETAVDETGASSGSLMLLNPNTGSLDIEATVGLTAKARRLKLRLGEGITGWVASTGKPFRVDDVRLEKRYVPIDPAVQSELAVPLDLNGQVVGILNVDSTEVGAFSEDDARRLTELARDASEYIRVSWEIDQFRNKARQLQDLVDMGLSIISQVGVEQVLAGVTRETCQLMKVKLCSLSLLSEDRGELVLKAWHGASKEYIDKPNLPVRDSLVGVVVNRLKPLTVLNVQEHHRYQHTELARREGLVSLLSVPLVFEGKPLGVLSVYTGQLHRFSNEEIRLLTLMAGLAGVAITKARLLERVVRVEEDLRNSERLSALGWLAAEIAHEIRNPLTVMQMLFHAMVQQVRLDDSTRRDAALIESKMQQMNRIVDQVLTFAQSSEPQLEQLDARTLMEDILLLTRHKMAGGKIEMRLRLAPEPLLIRADRAQIEQALLNLVLNAYQAMPKGGVVTLSARRGKRGKQPTVILAVSDRGDGISAERRAEIFEPFLSNRKGGTGLGLALVKKTVESHRGTIEVRSKEGKGTTFTLQFPA